MIGRLVLVLIAGSLLVILAVAFGLPPAVSAQGPLPTPEGRLGGRMPLPTAENPLGGSLPENTPTPSGHPLVGAWLLTFPEPDRAPARALFGDDGIVTFIDAVGSQGAGVWLPSGPQSAVMAVVVRVADASEREPPITMLQGRIEVKTMGDAATLVCTYTAETVDGSEITSERAGPFTATGQRVDEQLIVPAPE